MNGMRDALLRLVRAWTRTNKVLEAYKRAGMDSSVLFRVCAEIEEAICILVGEAEKDLEETVTHMVLTVQYLTEERRVSILMSKYKVNVVGEAELPAPHFTDPADDHLYKGYRPRMARWYEND